MSAPPEVVIGRAIGYMLGISAAALVLTAIVYGLLRLVGVRLKRPEQIIAFCVCFGVCLYAIISQHTRH
jgi:hydrogenase/urease accessory protein HupE